VSTKDKYSFGLSDEELLVFAKKINEICKEKKYAVRKDFEKNIPKFREKLSKFSKERVLLTYDIVVKGERVTDAAAKYGISKGNASSKWRDFIPAVCKKEKPVKEPLPEGIEERWLEQDICIPFRKYAKGFLERRRAWANADSIIDEVIAKVESTRDRQERTVIHAKLIGNMTNIDIAEMQRLSASRVGRIIRSFTEDVLLENSLSI